MNDLTYMFIIVLLLVIIIAFLCYSLIDANKKKDELIERVTIALSDVMALERYNRAMAETEEEEEEEDDPNFNPHDYEE